jgi:hypothetical protein
LAPLKKSLTDLKYRNIKPLRSIWAHYNYHSSTFNDFIKLLFGHYRINPVIFFLIYVKKAGPTLLYFFLIGFIFPGLIIVLFSCSLLSGSEYGEYVHRKI